MQGVVLEGPVADLEEEMVAVRALATGIQEELQRKNNKNSFK